MTNSDHAYAGRFDADKTHLLPVRVYYEDTDMTGVVYHAGYLRFFERGRSDYLRMIGVHHAELLRLDPPQAFAITAIDTRFVRAARIDDSLLVRTVYHPLQGARLRISQTITRGDAIIATAKVEAVSIDLEGRPRRPSPDLRAKLADWVVDEAAG